MISHTFFSQRNTSSGAPCSVSMTDGNVGSHLIDFHISSAEPERFVSLLGSILTFRLSLVPESVRDPSVYWSDTEGKPRRLLRSSVV